MVRLRHDALASVLLLSSLAAAQPASMVKDINTASDSSFGLQPQGMVALSGTVFLSGTAEGLGVELWKSDGTEGGTVLVKDIWPGSASSSPTGFVAMAGAVYFFADDGVHGQELWRTDGTTAGTTMVKDLLPGPGSSNAMYPVVSGGVLYFSTYDSTITRRLWRSDGTESGTRLVVDPCGASCPVNPSALTDVSGALFFNASSSPNGQELWRSDGTSAGTVLVKDVCAGSCNGNPASLTNVSGTLLFTASDGTNGTELWKSDGTTAGTSLVKDIRPGTSPSNPSSLLAIGGTLFFVADDGSNGTELWKSDGTPGGTSLVLDVWPGSGGSGAQWLVEKGGLLYFAASDGTHGRELWKSDGTPGGTAIVKDVCAGSADSILSSLTNVNGTLYFQGNDCTTGPELWKSDGTDAGTMLVRDICTGGCGSMPSLMTNANGTLFFRTQWASGELWRSDGTDAGTVVVREFASPSSFPSSFVERGGLLYFVASDGTSNRELFVSDGTPGGTSLVLDIGPFGGAGIQGGLAKIGSTLVFAGNDGTNGTELWKSDGTPAGTALLKEIWSGSGGSNPSLFTSSGSTLFFIANDSTNGPELWKTDGTPAGTALVKDIRSGTSGSSSANLVDVAGTLFFTASDGTNGTELWKSDGTTAGTVMVKDICAGSCGSTPAGLVAAGSALFFRATDNVNGWELWRSDGTAAGTAMVKDVCAGSCSSYPDSLTDVNGTVFFSAWNPDRELWKSDGTAAGTVLVKDICPGACESSPAGLAAAGGLLLFRASDGVHGVELFSSDGTAAGTALVLDIDPGAGSSIPRPIRAIGSSLLFAARDGAAGEELWKSNGTAAGTTRVVDANPGSGHGHETEALASGARVFFTADDGTHGQELWQLAATDLSVTQADSPDPVTQTSTLTWSITVTNLGTSAATGVKLTESLPAGVTFSSVVPGSPTCAHAAGTVTCDLGTTGAGGTWSVTVQATVDLAVVGSVSATARVTADEADTNGANDVSTVTTVVLGPQPARDLLAQPLSSSSIRLSWTDPNATETGFRLERSTDGGTWSAFDQVGGDVTAYTDSGRSPSTLHFYRVVALQSGAGESRPSNVASATTFASAAAKVCATKLSPFHGSARNPSFAHDPSGWAMAWGERGGGEGQEVYFQRLADANGTPLGTPVRVTTTGRLTGSPTLRWNGSAYGLLFTDGSEWRFALLDASGTKLRGDVSIPNFSARNNPGGETPLLWNGTEWAVLGAGEPGGEPPGDVYYQRLDADGDPIAGTSKLTATPEWEMALSAAWSGSEYGLVWFRQSVMGDGYAVVFQRLAPDGTLLGTPAVLGASIANAYTSIIWDGSAWVAAFVGLSPGQDEQAIYLCRISAGGTPQAPVRLSPAYDPDFPPEQMMPIADQAPLLLQKPGGGFEVFTASFLNTTRVWETCRYEADASLNRVGTRTVLSSGDGRNSTPPRAATDGSRFLLGWNESRTGNMEIADVLVDAAGSILAGPTDLTSGHAPGYPGNPVALALGAGFAALFADPDTPATTRVYGTFWDGAGNVVATRSPLSTRTVRTKPGAVAVGDTFALATKDSSNNVLFARYDATGAPIGTESTVATGASGRPYVAVDYSGEAYGLTFFSGNDLVFQRVASDGTLLGSRTTVTSTPNSGNPGPQIQWIGSGWALVWLQDSDLYYARLDPSGSVLVPPAQVTATPQDENGFQLLWNGSVLGLTWYDFRYPDPPGGLVLFTVLGLDGVPAFAPVALPGGNYDDMYPSLYWDQDRFRIVFVPGGPGTLREIAVMPEGTIVAGYREYFSTGGVNSVAWNGATLGIAWTQLGDVYFETSACLADATPPPCPSTAAVSDGTRVTVSWSAVADAESGIWRYDVYRDGSLVAEELPETTAFVDGGGAAGLTHAWEVRAKNGALAESTGCATVTPQADLAITKSDGGATATPGLPISYTITVTNGGPSTVTSVRVSDAVPAPITGGLFTPSAGSYDPGTGIWSGIALAPSQSATLVLSGTVVASARGTLANTATVFSMPGTVDPNGSNDTATDSDTLAPSANLSLTNSDAPDPALQGQALTYTLVVTNAGPSSATGVTLADPLPPGVTFQSASAGCADFSGTVTCVLGTIAPAGTSTVTITVKPNAGTVGTVTNTATVSSPDADPAPGDNTASASTSVPGPAAARDARVTARTTTTLSLRWTDPQGAETGFRVERSANGTSFSSVDIVGPNVTTYTDTGRAAATLYFYRVVALQSGVGEAPPSNVAAATTLASAAATVCATKLGSAAPSAGWPSVASDGTGWAAAWGERPSPDGVSRVLFQRLDAATGGPSGTPVAITPAGVPGSVRALRWNGTRFGLLWSESPRTPDAHRVTELRFALLDSAGAKVRGDVTSARLEDEGFHPGSGEIPLVWNGAGWGIFLAREAAPPSHLRYYRIDEDGDPVGTPVDLTSGPDWDLFVSAAWSGTDYGLAWVRQGTSGGSYQILFQRFALDGTPLGTPTVVWQNTTASTVVTYGVSTSVVRDGSSWVVAFTDVGPDPDQATAVYLRRLDSSGNPQGAAVRLSHDLDPDFPPEQAVPIHDDAPLLFTRSGGGFVVATTSWLNTTGVVEACRYEANASLARVGTRAVVSPNDALGSGICRAASDGTRLLVAWNESRSGTPEIADVLLDSGGAVLAGPTDLTSGHAGYGAGNPVALPLGGGFGAIFTNGAAAGTQLWGRFWDATGAEVATRAPLTSVTTKAKPGAVAVGNTFALAWKERVTNALRFGRWDATGAPLVTEATVATNVSGRPYVSLDFSGEVYGLAFETSTTVAFQRVAADGTPVGSRVTVSSVADWSQLAAPGPVVQWVGTGWAIAWVEDGDIHFSLVDPSGTVLVPAIQVTFTPQEESGLTLLWNGELLALSWFEYRYPDPPGGKVYFTVLGLDGIKAFVPVAIGSSQYDDTYPSVYWDVDRFRVVMLPGLPGDLHEVPVLPNGSLPAGERTWFNRGGPSGIAWNGATLGIAWSQLSAVYFETTACLADATPPACPPAAAVYDGAKTVVTWTAVADAESGVWRYDVYRDGGLVSELEPAFTSWVDTGVPPGSMHTYEVRAVNRAMKESSDCTPHTVVADIVAPVVTPPAAASVDQSACCGAFGGASPGTSTSLAAFVNGGSAADDHDPAPTRLAAQVAGNDVSASTCFPAGTTTVAFRFRDTAGNVGTATSTVTVLMFGDLNLDLAVDPSDMVILRAYFNFAIVPGPPPFTAPLRMADLTHDSAFDPSDLVMLRAYFNFAVSCLAP